MTQTGYNALLGEPAETDEAGNVQVAGAGEAGTRTDRIDEKLTVIRFDLYAGYLELLVEGGGFPKQFWCRVGSWEGSLRRRAGVPTMENEGRALYSVTLDFPLKHIDLPDVVVDGHAPASIDLRRGDRKGRYPKGWVNCLSFKSEEPVVAADPELSGLALEGWALNAAEPKGHVLLRLVERCMDEGGGVKEVQLASVIADQPSIEGQNRHGVSNTGFRLPLPEKVLDGSQHALALQACAEGQSVDLWAQDFIATDADMRQRLVLCQDSDDLYDRLTTLARTGRVELLASYFSQPNSFSSIVLKRSDAFSLLGEALLTENSGSKCPNCEVAREILEKKFRSLGREMGESEWLGAATDLASASLMSDVNDVSMRRFPHAPLVEAACDLASVATGRVEGRNATLKLASLCIFSKRYVLAQELLQSLVKTEVKHALPFVRAAGAEIGLGNFDAAESYVRQALEIRSKFREALSQMARIYVTRGQHLEAAAVLSGGKGLSQWARQPPPYNTSKLIAALDWRGLNEQIALASGNMGYLEHLRRADAIFAPPPDPRGEGFSLIMMDRAQRDLGALFSDLEPLGCGQVTRQYNAAMDEIEGMGGWSLIFRDVRSHHLKPEFVAALFAQMRCFEPVMDLQMAKMDELGLPEEFHTVGLLARNDTLRLFGASTLDEFAKKARSSLATKTLLI